MHLQELGDCLVCVADKCEIPDLLEIFKKNSLKRKQVLYSTALVHGIESGIR